MAKSKKMSIPQFRKAISNLKNPELSQLLCSLYKASPEASDFLNVALGNTEYETELLIKAKEKVTRGFFTKSRRLKLSLPTAKSAISDFKAVCSTPAALLDLQIHFIECGTEVAGSYYNLPASFYRDVENMIQTVISAINESDEDKRRDLYQQFEDRLHRAIAAAAGNENDLSEYMEEAISRIRWTSASSVPKGGAEMIDGAQHADYKEHTDDAQFADIQRTITANETLCQEDADLFYRVWFPLLAFVNEKEHIVEIDTETLRNGMNMDIGQLLSTALWENPTLIDEYLSEQKDKLTKEERYLLSGFRRKHVTGRFLVERHLKKGTILISLDDNKTYQVQGILSSWEEMIPSYELPLMIDTTLLPFHNVIIPDGIIYPLNVMLGGGIKKEMKDIYMTAKRRGQIITSL